MQRKKQKPAKQTEIAKKRIEMLFRLAKKETKENANKYMKIARRISTKNKVKFTPSQKKSFCKNCISYLVPGKNARVRMHKGMLIYYCLDCKHYSRNPLH